MLRVLVFAIERPWVGIARLPAALRAAGFRVASLCPADSYLAHTRHVENRLELTAQRPGDLLLDELTHALLAFAPHLVVPGDDATVAFMHGVGRRWREGRLNRLPAAAAAVLLDSLGDPEHWSETLHKGESRRAALAESIPVPPQAETTDLADALAFAAEVGYPVVLKPPYGSAGAGMRVCAGPEALAQALERVAHPPRAGDPTVPVRRYVRGLVEDPHGIAAARPGGGWMLQAYLEGTPAMHALTAWRGELLAGFTALKVRVNPPLTGPSSVVKFVEASAVAEAARRLVRRFRYSGFASLDFLVGADGSPTYLECNPRPSPVSHLGALAGPDLCAALHARLAGRPVPPPRPVHERLVALFPQEVRRDPESCFLTSAYHDVPVDDPELMDAYESPRP